MEFRIGLKIKFDLVENSIAFSFKRKMKGKRKERKRTGNKERRNSNQIKAHRRNSELGFKLFFALIKNSVGQQMIWQLQETWALQVEFSLSILPIA